MHLLPFAPFYQTNDDVAMRLIAEGHFVPGAGPLPFVMGMHVAIGELLAVAYRIAPRVPWYDLLLYASLIAAAIAIVRAWRGAWGIAFAASLLLPLFVSVQFSSVAMACAAGGVAMLVRQTRRLHGILGIALIVWGSLLRFDAAMLVAVVGALLALPFARQSTRWIAIAFVIAVALCGVNRLVYQRAGWGESYAYHRLHPRLDEFAAPERLTPEMLARLKREVGWSANDYALFRDWFYVDPAIYGIDRVRRAERVLYARAAWSWRGVAAAREFVLRYRLALVLLLAFVLGRLRRVIGYFLAATMLVVLVVALIGQFTKAPPPRIALPLLLLEATMLMIAARTEDARPLRAWPAIAGIVIAIYVSTVSMVSLYRQSEARRVAAGVAARDVAGLQRIPAKLFVLHGTGFPYEDHWRPFHAVDAPFSFISLGSSSHVPPFRAFLRRSGYEDLPWALCSDRNLVLVALPHVPPMLAQAMREHHRVEVAFEPLFRGERVTAWRCVPVR